MRWRRRCPAHHWHTNEKSQEKRVGLDLTVERTCIESLCCLCQEVRTGEEYRVWQGNEHFRRVVRMPAKKLWLHAASPEQEGH